MADISKIKPSNGTVYNIKDTTARNGLTNRPTSFVGTRSEWNALPVATQVKYSLVNLIGEGVYKNNGTGLDDIANTGGGASKNFQGTIEEWNQLTTAEKKAYDHASIPDSLDGNVTFPASKVMLNSGDSVEDALSYLETEHAVGKWIDGSDLYEKTVDCGNLPNSTYKDIAHNISNFGKLIELKGATSGGAPVPYTANVLANCISAFVTSTNIRLVTASDLSPYTAYVTIRYTKNS